MTTLIPTTPAPTTLGPDELPVIACARRYVPARREVVARVWLEDSVHGLLAAALSKANSSIELVSESGQVWTATSEFDDPVGAHVLLFRIPEILLYPGHSYFLRAAVVGEDSTNYGSADFAVGTT